MADVISGVRATVFDVVRWLTFSLLCDGDWSATGAKDATTMSDG
ncbi:hypothetical protein [Streptomyces sp. NPDC127039]